MVKIKIGAAATMPKIYDYKGFPNPTRVRIALAEKNLSDKVEFISIDVPGGEHKRPAFREKNPNATVPVLELEDGTCISECTAIMEYVDNLGGEPVLTGKTAKERAIIHMMQRRVEAGVLDAAATYFHHATPGLGPEVEVYQNREWGEKNRESAVAGMRYLDQVLTTQPFLAGERFTMVDITGFAGLVYAAIAKIEIPSELNNLKFWHERMAGRPSIASS
jgi:glutathione S-transferase